MLGKRSSLLLATAHLDEKAIESRTPPHCRIGHPQPLQWHDATDGLLAFSLELPQDPLADVRAIVPCLSSTAPEYAYCFYLEAFFADGLIACALSPIGNFPAKSLPPTGGETASPHIEPQIDIFSVRSAPQTAVLTVYVSTPDREAFKSRPALVSVSMQGPHPGDIRPNLSLPQEVDIPVPAKSQMQEDEEIAHRICSPTSVSMVLDSFGRTTEPRELARRAYHQGSDLYGVWPANIHAASRWDTLGYLLHFPSWQAALYLLGQGLPLIASLRYQSGELSRAAAPKTNGHLLVVRGCRDGLIEVNDPAAPTAASVPRQYDAVEFATVWLGRSALGYVLFPVENARL